MEYKFIFKKCYIVGIIEKNNNFYYICNIVGKR